MLDRAYERHFRGVLEFKEEEAARRSVAKIDRLFRMFQHAGDRAGQHACELVALMVRNRARWAGKTAASAVFMDWLVARDD